MITSVSINNVKSLRHLEVGLERLTVFVGANGSGKTSVLEALDLAVRVANASRKTSSEHLLGDAVVTAKEIDDVRDCDWLFTRGGSGDLSVECTMATGEFSVKAAPPRGFPPFNKRSPGKRGVGVQDRPADSNSASPDPSPRA